MNKYFTKEMAIDLVRENEGSEYDFTPYVLEPDWDFADIVDYYDTLEISDDNDYMLVCNDMEERISSCGFERDTLNAIMKALFKAEELVRLTS